MPIGVLELAHDLWIGVQLRKHLVNGGRHISRISQRGLDLRLKRPEIALPVQPEIQRRVEHRGYIERKLSSVAGQGSSTPVRSVGAEVVARGARKCPVMREAVVVKEARAKR